MSELNQKIQTTLTNDLYNKSPERIGGARWFSSSLTLNEFNRHVLSGRSFAVGVYRNNQRKASNFQSSQIIGLDFDEGNHALETLINHPITGRGALIYASPSWREDCKKWRVVFVLDEQITNAGRYVDLLKRLLSAVSKDLDGLDLVAKDGARLFFGHDLRERPALYHTNENARLSVAYLESLPQSDHAHHAPERPARPPRATSSPALAPVSGFSIPPALAPDYERFCSLTAGRNNALFELTCKFRDMGIKPDLAYSALYAGAVKNGYMAKDGVTAFNSSFYSAYSVLPRVSKKRAKNAGVISLWGVNETPVNDDFETITTYHVNLPYISDLPQNDLDLLMATDIVMIKSPTGTGKTELVKRYMAQLSAKLYRPARVLFLVHRVSLVRNTARRLNLPLYTDNLDPDSSVVSTVDSLHKFDNRIMPFDAIIIDEAGQVAEHMANSSTLGRLNDRVIAFKTLQKHLATAGRVVCMDATFTNTQALALRALMPSKRQFLRVKNDQRPPARPLDVIFDEGAMMNAVMKDAKEGFTALACSHKRQAYLAQKIAQNAGLRVLCVTADNADNAQIKEQIETINTLEIDLLIFSPSLGTGYDITRPAVAMYLWGAPRPLTGAGMVQMLSRCRNAGRYVVCGVQLFGDAPAPITRSVILSDTLQNARELGAMIDDIDRIELAHLYARLQSERMNALSDPTAFVKHALMNGFQFRDGLTDEDEQGIETLKTAGVEFAQWCKAQRLTAPALDDNALDDLRRAGQMSIDARLANERYHIEKTAGCLIDECIHDALRTIDQRRALTRFTHLLFGDNEPIDPAYLDKAYQDMTPRYTQRALIRRLLDVMGVYDLSQIENVLQGTKDEIITPAVATWLKDHAPHIRRAFGRYRQTDNPMTEARALLRGAGIILRAKTQRRGAERVQVYTIDGGALAFWRALALSSYKARCQQIADKSSKLQNVDNPPKTNKPTIKPKQMSMISPSFVPIRG